MVFKYMEEWDRRFESIGKTEYEQNYEDSVTKAVHALPKLSEPSKP